ncbi:MAG: ABC transporter substrate-binding protein [Burkholderiales bacterium]|nr:ABC transporter substrate-binding protein [Burkholderiales bacterium]
MSKNRQTNRTRRRVLAAGGAGVALSALGFPTVLRAQGAAPKVGVILPLTGVLAFPGVATRKGTELGIKMLAEQGTRLEVIYADTESKAENGRVAAEKLIRDGCTILVGAWDSGATISAAQAAEAAKVPLVVNVGSAPQITEQGFTQVFRNFMRSDQIVSRGAGLFKNMLGGGFQPKTAVMLHVNDTFGQAVAGATKGAWQKAGIDIRILETISYDARARDLSVEVAKARATGADLVAPVTRVNDAILIVREMVKQDYNPMAIYGPSSPGPYEKAFTDALGKYANDYLVSVPWYDPNRALTKRVLDRWTKEFPNDRFELNSGFGWEGMLVVADAVKRAQSSKPADLHAALRRTRIEDHIMYGGPIEFDPKGQNPNIGVPMLQVQNQQPMVVAPADVAQAKPVLPMRRWSERS